MKRLTGVPKMVCSRFGADHLYLVSPLLGLYTVFGNPALLWPTYRTYLYTLSLIYVKLPVPTVLTYHSGLSRVCLAPSVPPARLPPLSEGGQAPGRLCPSLREGVQRPGLNTFCSKVSPAAPSLPRTAFTESGG